jgi:hypothetical protein
MRRRLGCGCAFERSVNRDHYSCGETIVRNRHISNNAKWDLVGPDRHVHLHRRLSGRRCVPCSGLLLGLETGAFVSSIVLSEMRVLGRELGVLGGEDRVVTGNRLEL